MKVSDETMLFRKVDDEPMTAEEVLTRVYQSIQEKGYNPINQILGYLDVYKRQRMDAYYGWSNSLSWP